MGLKNEIRTIHIGSSYSIQIPSFPQIVTTCESSQWKTDLVSEGGALGHSGYGILGKSEKGYPAGNESLYER